MGNIWRRSALKRLLVMWLSLLMILIFTNSIWADEYQLYAGDVLEISVYGHEELQLKQVIIRPDGKFAFPMVGEVQAVGLEPAKLSESLKESLAKFIKDPQVLVNVLKYHTTRVYILGEVNRPGMYELEKTHNLLDVIGAAGGYTKYASWKTVYIVRKDTGSYQVANLERLLKKGDLSQNYVLAEGDLVYLSKNGISFVNDILPYIAAAYQINGMIK